MQAAFVSMTETNITVSVATGVKRTYAITPETQFLDKAYRVEEAGAFRLKPGDHLVVTMKAGAAVAVSLKEGDLEWPWRGP